MTAVSTTTGGYLLSPQRTVGAADAIEYAYREVREGTSRRRPPQGAAGMYGWAPNRRPVIGLDVMQGLIADRLVISIRTVETHLYRGMQKLGINDRRDL